MMVFFSHTEKVIVMACWHNVCWLNLLAANQSKSCQANRHPEGDLSPPGTIHSDESPGWLVLSHDMLPEVL